MDNSGQCPSLADWACTLDGLVAREPLCVGVSGGSDSLALMHIAALWARGEVPVTVLTVDHGLRAGSDREADEVGRKAALLDLDHITLRWDGPKPTHGLAEQAREARYRLMTGWCAAHGVNQLLVAHTLDDQAETLLMRLARGSGVDGLSAMAPVTMRDGVAVIRPLLGVSRENLRAGLTVIGETWIDDPTNEDAAYERIRMRQAAGTLSALGLTADALATSAGRLQRARQALDAMADTAMGRFVEAYPEGYCRLSADLLSEPEDIILRVLNRCLSAVGGLAYPVRQSALEKLCARLASEPPPAETLGGCRILRDGDGFCVVREPGRMPREPMRLMPGERRVWDGRFQVSFQASDGQAPQVEAVDVRPLMREGWDRVRHHSGNCPTFLRDGLVSFWREDDLLAVPHLNYNSDTGGEMAVFSADFCNYPVLRGARIGAMGTVT